MADNDELSRQVRKLTVDHAETRWLSLRLDSDMRDVREELRAIRATQDEHSERLAEHTARFDSIDNQLAEHGAQFASVNSQLRSLTQLVGQVLERLPGGPGRGGS